MNRALILFGCIAALVGVARGGPYRTDAAETQDPWFELKPGEFPPLDAAHAVPATLTWANPYLRAGEYRPDERVIDHLFKMVPFTLLPYAQVRFHGAPADIRDIPPGLHVHLKLFQNADKNAFTQVLKVSDDFSECQEKGITYRVEKLALDQQKIVLSRQPSPPEGSPLKPTAEYMVDARTKLWIGHGFAEPKDLAVGQTVLANFAVGTAMLPVVQRCTDIWLDDASRQLATTMARDSQRVELNRRGLPAFVDHVDNHAPTLTLTLFDCGFPDLLDNYKKGQVVRLAVADETTRTVEPVGGQGGYDSVESEILELKKIPILAGSSGLQLTLRPQILLEGFRPRHVIRIAPPGFVVLPAEEHLEY